MTRPLIVANWKMNHTVQEGLLFYTHLIRARLDPDVELVICPPFTSLYSLSVAMSEETHITLGAQNCHYETSGPFTGEVSPVFLAELGCRYVLVGHSERRHLFGEKNVVLAKKVLAAIQQKLIPIYCVGETLEERTNNQTFDVIEQQLNQGLDKIPESCMEPLVVAYEPVWAIGTGKTATPEQAQEVHRMIRNWVDKSSLEYRGSEIRILYGGSVTPSNMASLMSKADIDGVLVGGASLDVSSFIQLVNYLDRS